MTNFKPLLCLLLLCALPACTSTTREVQQTPANNTPTTSTPQVREVRRAPQQLQDLSGQLLRYHAQHRALPPSLDALGDPLPDYTYHPKGLGTLPDGRDVLLVDTQVRLPGHAWCILRQPTRQRRTLQLDVSAVPLQQLQDAASKPIR